MTDILPPHDADMERNVLGSMLLDGEAANEAIRLLLPEDFYTGSHARIFEAARTVYQKDGNIDHAMVRTELGAMGVLEEIGGAAYLADLLTSVPTSAHIEQYATTVKRASRMRGLINIGLQLTRRGYEAGLTPDTVLSEVSDQLLALSRGGGNVKLVKDAARTFYKRLESGEQPLGLKVGLDPIDSALGGLRAGEYVLIAGRPSHGKSTVALRILLNLAKRGVGCFLSSLEMSEQQLVNQMVWLESGVDSVRALPEGERKTRALKSTVDVANLPIRVDDITDSLFRIGATIRAEALAGRCKVAVIDYLQLVECPESENRQVTVSRISRTFKHIAAACGIPLVVLAQLNRQSETNNRAPILSDLRESGSLEQDADAVVLVWRPNHKRPLEEGGDDGELRLTLAKNRMGPLGVATYMHRPSGQFEHPGAPA